MLKQDTNSIVVKTAPVTVDTPSTLLLQPECRPRTANLSQADNDQVQPAAMEKHMPQRDSPDLLTLPLEIRHAIWDAMVIEVDRKSNRKWFKRPKIEFASLMMTCSQLRDELREYRPQHFITQHGFDIFAQSFKEDWTKNHRMVMRRCRSISIEFGLHSSNRRYFELAKVLHACSPALEDLRLIFIGKDRTENRVYLHGCANTENFAEKMLHKDDQRFEEAKALQEPIVQMQKLRTLVLSNMNMQLFPGALMHKPKLQYLHLTADPRSVLHKEFDMRQLGCLMHTSRDYFPPLRILNIAANTMLNAFSVPSNCAMTLEHLTWTIPDAWLGSNHMNRPIYDNTFQLMANLVMNAQRLKTLRICVQGPGCREDDQQHLALEQALVQQVPRIGSLRNLEVHANRASSYLGYELLSSLPRDLKRFYTNDRLVLPRELNRFVTEKYLSASERSSVETKLDREEQLLQRWDPKQPLASPDKDLWPEFNTMDERVKMWINPTSYIPIEVEGSVSALGVEIERRCGVKGDRALFLPGIIGEDFRRKDYIPLRNGRLKFIAYEFHNPDFVCRTGGTGETLTQMVLRLNGRLLDRDRNEHLYQQRGCETINPCQPARVAFCSESSTTSANSGISLLLHSIYEIESINPRDTEAALAELMSSPFVDDDRYFGREDEAMRIFYREKVAESKDLPYRTEPYPISCGSQDDQCHWMCPEMSVPTLLQVDEARVRRAEMIKRQQETALVEKVPAIRTS